MRRDLRRGSGQSITPPFGCWRMIWRICRGPRIQERKALRGLLRQLDALYWPWLIGLPVISGEDALMADLVPCTALVRKPLIKLVLPIEVKKVRLSLNAYQGQLFVVDPHRSNSHEPEAVLDVLDSESGRELPVKWLAP